MSGLEIDLAFPLTWPGGRPRTAWDDRRYAAWKHDGRALTLHVARQRLQTQLEAISSRSKFWRTRAHVLSCNIRFTRSGARDQNFRREPEDPGAALYFELDRRPLALACDRWTTVQDNIAAIAAHIEALRGQERWGVADLAQAFAGHAALPPPSQHEAWWTVLGVSPSATPDEIDAAWRAAMRTAHPDQGGSHAAASRLNQARDEGKQTNG